MFIHENGGPGLGGESDVSSHDSVAIPINGSPPPTPLSGEIAETLPLLSGAADHAEQEFCNNWVLRLMHLFACLSGGSGLAVGAYAQNTIIADAKNWFGADITPSPAKTFGLSVLPTMIFSAFNDQSFLYWRQELYNAFVCKKTSSRNRKIEFICFTIFSLILTSPQYYFTLNGLKNTKSDEIYSIFQTLAIPIAATNAYGTIFANFNGMYKLYRHFVHGESNGEKIENRFHISLIFPLVLAFLIATFIFILFGELSLPSGKPSPHDPSITCPRKATTTFDYAYNTYSWASFIPQILTMTVALYEKYKAISFKDIITFLKDPYKLTGVALTGVCSILQGYALEKGAQGIAECIFPGLGATGIVIAKYTALAVGTHAFTILWVDGTFRWVKISTALWEKTREYARQHSYCGTGSGSPGGAADEIV